LKTNRMHCKDTILRTQNNWPYSKFIPNSGILDKKERKHFKGIVFKRKYKGGISYFLI